MCAARDAVHTNMARSIGSGFLIGAFIKIMQVLTGQSGAFGKRGVGFEQTLPAAVWTMFNVVMGASEQATSIQAERGSNAEAAGGEAARLQQRALKSRNQ